MRFALSLFVVSLLSVAHAQSLTFERPVVERAGAKDILLPGVPEQPYTSIALPGGGLIRFSVPLTRQDVPSGWSVWRENLTPKVFESPDGLSVSFFFSKPAAAFGVELMPVWRKGRDMRLEIIDEGGKSMTRFVKVDPGAEFFGFVNGHVRAVRFSKLPFDEGSFAMGRMLFAPAK